MCALLLALLFAFELGLGFVFFNIIKPDAQRQPDIIDEPDAADCRGDEQAGIALLGRGAEVAAAHLKVVRLNACCAQDFRGNLTDLIGTGFGGMRAGGQRGG